METGLAEDTLYSDSDRSGELSELLKSQTRLKESIESLEWDWMKASEELEAAG